MRSGRVGHCICSVFEFLLFKENIAWLNSGLGQQDKLLVIHRLEITKMLYQHMKS